MRVCQVLWRGGLRLVSGQTHGLGLKTARSLALTMLCSRAVPWGHAGVAPAERRAFHFASHRDVPLPQITQTTPLKKPEDLLHLAGRHETLPLSA